MCTEAQFGHLDLSVGLAITTVAFSFTSAVQVPIPKLFRFRSHDPLEMIFFSFYIDLYWLPSVSWPLFVNRKMQRNMMNKQNLFYLNNFELPKPFPCNTVMMKITRHYRICVAMMLYTHVATSVSRGSPKMPMQMFPCKEIT